MADTQPENTLDALPIFTDHHGEPELWPGLRIEGLVRNPTLFVQADLETLTQQILTDDFRCLEGWSVPDQNWEGVPPVHTAGCRSAIAQRQLCFHLGGGLLSHCSPW